MLLNLNPQKKIGAKNTKSSENILVRVNTEMEVELSEVRKQKENLANERCSLLDSLKRTNEDFIMLKKKRIQDVSMFSVVNFTFNIFSCNVKPARRNDIAAI